MKSKYNLILTITTALVFLIGCGNSKNTDGEENKTDSTKIDNVSTDSSGKKMNSMNMDSAGIDMMTSMNNSMSKWPE